MNDKTWALKAHKAREKGSMLLLGFLKIKGGRGGKLGWNQRQLKINFDEDDANANHDAPVATHSALASATTEGLSPAVV